MKFQESIDRLTQAVREEECKRIFKAISKLAEKDSNFISTYTDVIAKICKID